MQTQWRFTATALIAAFGTYTCMYAFRRPFAVGEYQNLYFLGVNFKIALIIAQVAGYTFSKFIGIRIIAAMPPALRAFAIVICIVVAELCLLAFSVTPPTLGVLWLFLNGIPLGLVWGLVFSFLEGRRNTELLGAGLCVTFVISSGFVKSVGLMVMKISGVGEFAQPWVTGMLFFPFLLIFSYLLARLPAPSEDDKKARVERVPMTKVERRHLLKEFLPGLVALIVFYAALTAYRDLRDNFAREIWAALGFTNAPYIFTIAEIPVALAVLFALGMLYRIRDNRLAFRVNLYILLGCGVFVALSTVLYRLHIMGGATWMILVGVGSYGAYIPFNAMLFERMIAAFRLKANAGFFIYLADSFGYLASVLLLLFRNFGNAGIGWLDFFETVSYALALATVIFVGYAIVYFRRRSHGASAAVAAP
jgi:Family of unknown function (DUF5690)